MVGGGGGGGGGGRGGSKNLPTVHDQGSAVKVSFILIWRSLAPVQSTDIFFFFLFSYHVQFMALS